MAAGCVCDACRAPPRNGHAGGSLHGFFCLMIGRPPRSPLFPTRRSSDLMGWFVDAGKIVTSERSRGKVVCAVECNRSEEHTSELQSRLHLVCRLLLEK